MQFLNIRTRYRQLTSPTVIRLSDPRPHSSRWTEILRPARGRDQLHRGTAHARLPPRRPIRNPTRERKPNTRPVFISGNVTALGPEHRRGHRRAQSPRVRVARCLCQGWYPAFACSCMVSRTSRFPSCRGTMMTKERECSMRAIDSQADIIIIILFM
jgi:hypothetical protein